jgi:signal transduction histidine kinase
LSGDTAGEGAQTDAAEAGSRRIAHLVYSPAAAYALIAFLLIGLGALAARYHADVAREATDAVASRRLALAQFAATTFSERLDRTSDLAVSLASRVRFAELVAAQRWQDAAAILRAVPEKFPHLERLFLADTAGNLRADVPPLGGVIGRNFAERDWYRGVSRDWKTYVSPVYRRAAHPQRNVIAVATPVLAPATGAAAGILVLQISLEAFFGWADAVELPAGVSLMVVDSKEQVAYASGAAVQGPIVQRAKASGADRLAAAIPAKHGWGVVIEQPAADAFAARDAQLALVKLAYGLMAAFLLTAAWLGARIARSRAADLEHARASLARHGERLRILHEIDRAIVARRGPEAIAGAVIQPLRELLGVPRAIVNRFDLAAGEVEWIAAAGRRRMHVGPGVRYSIRLMGEVEALRRGEPQRIDVQALPSGPEREALLASDVRVYMAVPMIAGEELIGALSFGGRTAEFPAEQLAIAQEVATQLAIAIAQANLHERVHRHAEELERRVAERTAELRALNKELESFTYSVSHDLRAPLRAIDGFGRIIEEEYGPRLDDEARRLLAVVRSSSKQMGQLIDDLLDFSRLGRQDLGKQSVDMAALAREAARALGIQPALGELPAAHADPALLRQVWLNLLGNAAKYSGKRAEPRIEVGGREEGAGSLYWVRDNGVGFDMRYAGKLFGVFQRLHGADEFPGTGVGLAIVQRVVSRHGGRVWAEGRVGEGACFYFTLPGNADG